VRAVKTAPAPAATTVPPCNLELEAAVLAQMMASSASLDLGLSRLRARDFFKEHHRRIFDQLAALRAAGQVVDVLTVANALAAADELEEIGGRAAIIGLAGLASTHGQLESYVAAVLELSTKRQLLALGLDLARDAQNGCATSELLQLVSGRLEGIAPPAVTAIASATLAEILAVDPVKLQTSYVVTPWIPRASVCTLSARAGVGKGKLAQDLCLARASRGTWLGLPVEAGPALFWSGEQGRREDFRVTQALCRGRGLTGPDRAAHYFEIVYDPSLRFGHPAMVAYVTERLRQHPGLFIVIDSQRRAFEGDESDSAAADAFYRSVLMPLRAAGATTLTLAHPPKTIGKQKVIADENMIRGSGDWLAQLDSFMVLRPVERHRLDQATETVTMRLIHVKPRSGPQADPLLINFTVTKDLTPDVTFTLRASTAPLEAESTVLAGAIKATAALFEEKKRLARSAVLEHLQTEDIGREVGEAALARLVALGVIRGPLTKEDKRKGERGHWYVFLQPLPPTESVPDWVTEPPEWPDEP
jgi:hypothetical protein